LVQGGKIFLAYANVTGDLQNSALKPANDIGLTSWVNTKGVMMGNQFVIDAAAQRGQHQLCIQFH
jgi:hypothetical protein